MNHLMDFFVWLRLRGTKMENNIQIIHPIELNAIQKEELLAKLYPLTNIAFEKKMPIDAVRRHTLDVDLLVVAMNKQHFIGYVSSKFEPTTTHIYGGIVSPEMQGHGLCSEMFQQTIDYFQTEFITANTQNPLAYIAVRKIAKANDYEIFPNSTDEYPSEIINFAQSIINETDNKLIIRNAYKDGRLCPKSVTGTKDYEANILFNQLNIEAGDAFSIICRRKNNE
jgi:hypothetical protein